MTSLSLYAVIQGDTKVDLDSLLQTVGQPAEKSEKDIILLLQHSLLLRVIWFHFKIDKNQIKKRVCILLSPYTVIQSNISKTCSKEPLGPQETGMNKVKLSFFFSGRHFNSPWSPPGQNTGVGSLSLLQGIFPTQRSNPGLPHCR